MFRGQITVNKSVFKEILPEKKISKMKDYYYNVENFLSEVQIKTAISIHLLTVCNESRFEGSFMNEIITNLRVYYLIFLRNSRKVANMYQEIFIA